MSCTARCVARRDEPVFPLLFQEEKNRSIDLQTQEQEMGSRQFTSRGLLPFSFLGVFALHMPVSNFLLESALVSCSSTLFTERGSFRSLMFLVIRNAGNRISFDNTSKEWFCQRLCTKSVQKNEILVHFL